jgi:hypothetical protein
MHWPALLTAFASAGVQFVLFLRWLHRRMRDDEINRAFLRDLALNHLPHIYDVLQTICQQQGTKTRPAPTVRYVDLHGANGHRRAS